MPTQSRSTLSRQDIDQKAEEVVLHFDPHALERPSCPLWDVVNGLKERYHIPFHFYQELGYSSRGKKILGRFDFHPRQVLIDRILPHDSPRFRWTLGHEIGHLVLHRRLDPSRISQDTPSFVDTRTELRFLRSAQWSDLRWIEWQATYFGSALLLPRPVVLAAVIRLQVELGITRLGTIYLDDQPCNVRDSFNILRQVSKRLNVSIAVLRIRLLNLGILTDARRVTRDHVQETLRALFSEDNSASTSQQTIVEREPVAVCAE